MYYDAGHFYEHSLSSASVFLFQFHFTAYFVFFFLTNVHLKYTFSLDVLKNRKIKSICLNYINVSSIA